MLAAKDWYAIGASFRGRTMGVRRPDASMSPVDVAVMKHAFSQPGVATGGVNYYRANFFRPTPPAISKALREKLRMPVLVIWGEGDQAMGVELLEGIEKHAHELRLELLPGTSHWVQVDNPKDVSRLLREFAREQQQRQQRQQRQEQQGHARGEEGDGGSRGTRVTAGSRL
jgi:pimeloyl-ACP methyl ester carboxylesterase